jgi:EPS-associated MarR family transcriptional regulator
MNEPQFKTLRELAMNGTLSQRELSKKMGLSLGKVNYLVNSLLSKGYVKARRFKNSKNKIAYMYVLTPKGISVKFAQTYNFLQRKLDEFDRLKAEIETLRRETDGEIFR